MIPIISCQSCIIVSIWISFEYFKIFVLFYNLSITSSLFLLIFIHTFFLISLFSAANSTVFFIHSLILVNVTHINIIEQLFQKFSKARHPYVKTILRDLFLPPTYHSKQNSDKNSLTNLQVSDCFSNFILRYCLNN